MPIMTATLLRYARGKWEQWLGDDSSTLSVAHREIGISCSIGHRESAVACFA
jgi:hypothetical protein